MRPTRSNPVSASTTEVNVQASYSVQQHWASRTKPLDFAFGALPPSPGFVGANTVRYRQDSSLGEPSISGVALVAVLVF